DASPVHRGKAKHIVRRFEIDEIAVLIEMRNASAFTYFAEAAFVGKRSDPLAHGEAALGVVAFDRFLAALPLRQLAAAPDLVGFLLPAHGYGCLPFSNLGTLEDKAA